MKKSIIWLASYPKSGNTWTRIFLSNYLANPSEPLSINQVHRLGMGDSIAKAYHKVAGREIDVHDIGLTLQLRDSVLRSIVANNADVNFVKTHNIRDDALGVPLIPDQYTRSAVYIMRNPLDMVLSYARHYGISPDEATYNIGRDDCANSADPTTVTQFLGSWSQHVLSWTRRAAYPQCILRYEDLLENPEEHFGRLLEHIGIPLDEARLKKAIRFSSFRELKKQEKKHGFGEHSGKSDGFFAKGKAEQWRTDLAPELVDKIRKDHRNTMKKYGYLE